jgi:hypothetical protein
MHRSSSSAAAELARRLRGRLNDGSLILSVAQQKELAALLRELADDVERCHQLMMEDPNWIVPLADRARAAADQLTREQA